MLGLPNRALPEVSILIVVIVPIIRATDASNVRAVWIATRTARTAPSDIVRIGVAASLAVDTPRIAPIGARASIACSPSILPIRAAVARDIGISWISIPTVGARPRCGIAVLRTRPVGGIARAIGAAVDVLRAARQQSSNDDAKAERRNTHCGSPNSSRTPDAPTECLIIYPTRSVSERIRINMVNG